MDFSLTDYVALMCLQVTVDGIGEFHWNTLTLGVTGTHPAQLAVTMWSEDLEDSIIIRHSGVSRHGKIVSLYKTTSVCE